MTNTAYNKKYPLCLFHLSTVVLILIPMQCPSFRSIRISHLSCICLRRDGGTPSMRWNARLKS